MKRRQLGSASAEHAKKVRLLIGQVKDEARQAQRGTCGIRLTSLVVAQHHAGELWAHAFGSGGRTAKGALSPKTVSAKVAQEAYDAVDLATKATQKFRRECLK